MGMYYAAVEAYDAEGQAVIGDGLIYGGEARFFVLEAESLAEALEVLSGSMAANGLRLDRVLHAGDAEAFDDDLVPFEVDLPGMAEAAAQAGEICVTEAHVFEPGDDPAPSGLFACGVEAFDMDWADEAEGDYAGHYQLAVIKAADATEALRLLVMAMDEAGCELLAVEDLVDAALFPFDAYEIEFESEDPLGDAASLGGVVLSAAHAFPLDDDGPEEPARLTH